jgi:hypothetical protein
MGIALVIILLLTLWVAPIFVARWLGRAMESPSAWLWGLFLGWIGVLVLCARYPFKATKLMRQSMKDAGLSTTMSGASAQAAGMMKRLTGEIEGGKKCPACAETVQGEASVCRYCGHSFEKIEAPAELA